MARLTTTDDDDKYLPREEAEPASAAAPPSSAFLPHGVCEVKVHRYIGSRYTSSMIYLCPQLPPPKSRAGRVKHILI